MHLRRLRSSDSASDSVRVFENIEELVECVPEVHTYADDDDLGGPRGCSKAGLVQLGTKDPTRRRFIAARIREITTKSIGYTGCEVSGILLPLSRLSWIEVLFFAFGSLGPKGIYSNVSTCVL